MIGGGAVSKDGVTVARRPPDAFKVAQVRDQLQQNADISASTRPGLNEPSTNSKQLGVLMGCCGSIAFCARTTVLITLARETMRRAFSMRMPVRNSTEIADRERMAV
jgi:hypothetical protein